LTPKGIETTIKVHSKGPAAVVGTDNPYIKAATEALHDTFKKDTVFIRSGGSIPIVTDFQDVLKIPSVMMGFGFPTTTCTLRMRSFIFRTSIAGLKPFVCSSRSWGKVRSPRTRFDELSSRSEG